MSFTQQHSIQTKTSEPVINLTGLTLGSFFEQDGQYLKNKLFKDFSKTSRTIFQADGAEYGWTITNVANATSASCNENTTTVGVATIVPAAISLDWFTPNFTAPLRTKTYEWNGKLQSIIGHISSNAVASGEVSGLIIKKNGANTPFIRCYLTFDAGDIKIGSQTSSYSSPAVVISEAQRNAGIWWQLMVTPDGYASARYCISASSTPPTTGWVWSTVNKNDFNSSLPYSLDAGHYAGNANLGNNVQKILYYDDSGMGDVIIGNAIPPTWCAQGYSTGNDVINLLTDYDMGTAAPAINDTYLRKILADVINKNTNDATTWTFSSIQSPTTGAVAGTYQAVNSIITNTTGRYYNLFAKCNSDGFQSGSIFIGNGIRIPIITT